MGAITRSAANNITTSGVILPAGINDASVASITALAQVSAGDGITLISSQTASASASLSFTTGIDSTYRTYLFKFINIHAGTDDIFFQVNFRDGDSAFDATKTSTAFGAYHSEAGDTQALFYSTARDLAQSTDYQSLIVDSIGIENDESLSGEMYLFLPSSTTFVKHFKSRINIYHDSDYTFDNHIDGYCNVTTAINGVDFKMSSGNIDSGTIHMYGIA